MPKPVLVIGATRGTGLIIATRLLEHGTPVRIVARNLVKARAAFGSNAEIIKADLSAPNGEFQRAFHDVEHIIFTAAVPPGPATEDQIRAVDYGGVVATLRAATASGFKGRFLYMTTIGTTRKSFAGYLLGVMKKGVMRWRREAEEAIRTSDLRWTIIRAGVLTNDGAGLRAVELVKGDIPLRARYKIGRADVADVFLEAMRSRSTERKEFSVIWAKGDVASLGLQLQHM
jgi:uncharacterized protein YbjT (DUF2867 family)